MAELAAAKAPSLASRLADWLPSLAAVTILLALSLVIYRDAAEKALTVWMVSPTYTHCFLIAPISLWLIWQRRAALRRLTPHANPFPIFLAGPVAVALWLAGVLATVNEAQQLALVTFWQLCLWSMLGWSIYRTILFACLYLYLLVPMGEYLIPAMQDYTAAFIDVGLTFLNIAHGREGMIINVPSGRFHVAEACAGLRFLIATVTLGLLYCDLTYRRPLKIALFLLASLAVPIFANWLRALIMVLLAYFSDNQIAVGFDHVVYGWGFSVGILLLLFVVGGWFRDSGAGQPPVLTIGRSWSLRARSGLLAVSFAAALCMIGAGPLVVAQIARAGGGLDEARSFIYPAPHGWHRTPATTVFQPHAAAASDKSIFALMRNDGKSVDVGLFRFDGADAGRRVAEATESLWDDATWRQVETGTPTMRLAGREVALRETLLETVSERRLVWWVCIVGDGAATGGVKLKLLALRSALLGRPGATLAILSTRMDTTLAEARGRLTTAGAGLGNLLTRSLPAPEPVAN